MSDKPNRYALMLPYKCLFLLTYFWSILLDVTAVLLEVRPPERLLDRCAVGYSAIIEKK